MKTLPALLLAVFTALIFAPYCAEVALSLLAVVMILAIFLGDYRRSTPSVATVAAKHDQRLPLAA